MPSNKKQEPKQPCESTEKDLEQNQGETGDMSQTQDQGSSSDEAEDIIKELDAMKSANSDLNDKLLRTMAEFDNFRKRSQKEKEAIYPDAIAYAVNGLLPVLDNFERAMTAETTDPEFKKGVQLILQQFKDGLSKLGIEEICCDGCEFDPNLHNAVMHIEDDSFPANHIVEVLQRGYKMGEKVIRYAMVKVAN